MRPKKQKYYVVWQGHHPGIYSSWEACKAEVHNFPDARYKSYETKAEAEAAYVQGPVKTIKPFTPKSAYTKQTSTKQSSAGIIRESISVDAACSGNPGLMEYRGVRTADRTEIFHYGPAKDGTNNIGEFLALVHALAYLQKKNEPLLPIYSDSKTAISWVKKKKANTKLMPTRHNGELFDMILRAEKWLKENTFKNPILKWETEHWGEIPADFGRK
jgi:ribonuclease HI